MLYIFEEKKFLNSLDNILNIVIELIDNYSKNDKSLCEKFSDLNLKQKTLVFNYFFLSAHCMIENISDFMTINPKFKNSIINKDFFEKENHLKIYNSELKKMIISKNFFKNESNSKENFINNIQKIINDSKNQKKSWWYKIKDEFLRINNCHFVNCENDVKKYKSINKILSDSKNEKNFIININDSYIENYFKNINKTKKQRNELAHKFYEQTVNYGEFRWEKVEELVKFCLFMKFFWTEKFKT
ncbi:MAG: hypothetical protein ACRDCF_01280 [Mycoplasmoidaceae bacterium]